MSRAFRNKLIWLRKEGIINPIKPGGRWRYSEEQVRQIPSLIAEARKCQQCGKPRPLGSHRFCRECRQYRENHKYEFLSPEGKAKHIKRSLARRKANPEEWKEIQSRQPVLAGPAGGNQGAGGPSFLPA